MNRLDALTACLRRIPRIRRVLLRLQVEHRVELPIPFFFG